MIFSTKKKDNSSSYSIILVFSTSHALRAEKLLNNADIHCKLVPVPRHLSSDCGVSLRIEKKDKENTLKVFGKYDFDIDSMHDL